MRLEEGKQRHVLPFALTQASNAAKSASAESAPPHLVYCFPHTSNRDTQTKVHTPHFGFSRFETGLNRKKKGCQDADKNRKSADTARLECLDERVVRHVSQLCRSSGVREQTGRQDKCTTPVACQRRQACIGTVSPRQMPGDLRDLVGVLFRYHDACWLPGAFAGRQD